MVPLRGGIIDIRLVLSGLVELLGLAAIVTGAALVYIPAAFLVGGVGLLWLARAVDPPHRPPPRPALTAHDEWLEASIDEAA